MNPHDLLRILTGCALTASAVVGQAMSSSTFLAPSTEFADGCECLSTTFRSDLALGASIVLNPAASPSFRTIGGFAATLDSLPDGFPWVTHCEPGRVTPSGLAQLTVHGIDLDRGSGLAIRIGPRSATIRTRTRSRATATLPRATTPGFPVVTLATSAGSSSVSDRLGVLPLLTAEPAPAPNLPFELAFRGSPSDQVIWAIGIARGPVIQLPPMLHGLALHPGLLVVLPGFVITHASGEFRMRIPATAYLSPLYAQAVFRTTDPGYAPGAFSNVLSL